MRLRFASALSLAVLLVACGGGGPPTPAGLAYSLPNPATASYLVADTATVEIDAGGQLMEARVQLGARFDATFTRAADGIQVSFDVAEFGARIMQPMGPPATVDGTGIDGPLVFSIDRKGAATLVSQPTMSEEVGSLFPSLSTAHTFFPRLPGTAVGAGDTWTDTIAFSGSEAGGDVSYTARLTYTAAGDTVVDGRRLMKIVFEGDEETVSEGNIQGMDVAQELAGTLQGHVLWDMGRSMMVEQVSESDASGSMEVAMAPFPLEIRARKRHVVRSADGM